MTSGSSRFDRVIWIVLDSVGIGELPDAKDYGDVGRDTLGHIARSRTLRIPSLQRLQKLSEPFGTKLTIEGNTGIIRMAPRATKASR